VLTSVPMVLTSVPMATDNLHYGKFIQLYGVNTSDIIRWRDINALARQRYELRRALNALLPPAPTTSVLIDPSLFKSLKQRKITNADVDLVTSWITTWMVYYYTLVPMESAWKCMN
jgi:hypothetical protein